MFSFHSGLLTLRIADAAHGLLGAVLDQKSASTISRAYCSAISLWMLQISCYQLLDSLRHMKEARIRGLELEIHRNLFEQEYQFWCENDHTYLCNFVTESQGSRWYSRPSTTSTTLSEALQTFPETVGEVVEVVASSYGLYTAIDVSPRSVTLGCLGLGAFVLGGYLVAAAMDSYFSRTDTFYEVYQLKRRLNTHIRQSFERFDVVRQFGAEETELQLARDAAKVIKDPRRQRDKFIESLVYYGIFMSAGYGIVSRFSGQVGESLAKLKDVSLLSFKLFRSVTSALNLGSKLPEMKENTLKLGKDYSEVFYLLNRKTKVLQGKGVYPNEPAKGEIEFKNVSFCYPSSPEVKVLNRINLRCPMNQTTAFVGVTGKPVKP